MKWNIRLNVVWCCLLEMGFLGQMTSFFNWIQLSVNSSKSSKWVLLALVDSWPERAQPTLWDGGVKPLHPDKWALFHHLLWKQNSPLHLFLSSFSAGITVYLQDYQSVWYLWWVHNLQWHSHTDVSVDVDATHWTLLHWCRIITGQF